MWHHWCGTIDLQLSLLNIGKSDLAESIGKSLLNILPQLEHCWMNDGTMLQAVSVFSSGDIWPQLPMDDTNSSTLESAIAAGFLRTESTKINKWQMTTETCWKK